MENIAYKYIENKDTFELYSDQTQETIVSIPHAIMKKTLPIVSQTISLSPLRQMEFHSFNEINTWANDDESLAQELADLFIQNKDIPIEEPVYPAHIVSGAIMALIKSSETDLIDISEKVYFGVKQDL